LISEHFDKISEIVSYLSDVYELLKKASVILSVIFEPLISQVKEDGGEVFSVEIAHVNEYRSVLAGDKFLKCVLTEIKNKGQGYKSLRTKIEAIEEDLVCNRKTESCMDIDDLVEQIKEPSNKESKKLDEEIKIFREKLEKDSMPNGTVHKLKVKLSASWEEKLNVLNKRKN